MKYIKNYKVKIKKKKFPRPRSNARKCRDSKKKLRDLRHFIFLGYRKFRYCSRMYVRNWFTLLNEQNRLLDFEGTRFVNERSLFWEKKIYPPTYRPIGEMEGRMRETNIFLRMA